MSRRVRRMAEDTHDSDNGELIELAPKPDPRVEVPFSLYDDFRAIHFDANRTRYNDVLHACLRSSCYRRLGEWMCDELGPSGWRASYDVGFRRGPSPQGRLGSTKFQW